MHIIEMQLQQFFSDHLNHYTINDLEFIYSEDGSLQVCSPVPGLVINQGEISMDLTSKHENLVDFIYEYVLTDTRDLNFITPEFMLKRFMVGRCSLFCYLDTDLEYSLSYTRKGRRLIAKDKDNNLHEVPEYVKSPEELLIYSQRYFEKLISG